MVQRKILAGLLCGVIGLGCFASDVNTHDAKLYGGDTISTIGKNTSSVHPDEKMAEAYGIGIGVGISLNEKNALSQEDIKAKCEEKVKAMFSQNSKMNIYLDKGIAACISKVQK